ncbi:hypothetical protein D5H75_19990 [Bailinhaonella thermotolerans]|uniref:Uncharacterized protein n=1 Tax=Bailinhaonella thermotolerans TaxID=1070861 RepID=A0A3A4B1P9_9ACTN|nr:hypothetical protein D5H75_19990 [Bailinhaonella thermotolerans]
MTPASPGAGTTGSGGEGGGGHARAADEVLGALFGALFGMRPGDHAEPAGHSAERRSVDKSPMNAILWTAGGRGTA